MPVTGVVAVYYAAQVQSAVRADDLGRANWLARRARAWTLVGFVLFLIIAVWGIANGMGFRLMDWMRG